MLILIIITIIILYILRLIILNIFKTNLDLILIILPFLWLPSMLIRNILYYILNNKYSLNTEMFFKNINVNNYNNFWKMILIIQSFKFFFFTFTEYKYLFGIYKYFDFKDLNKTMLKSSVSPLFVKIGLLTGDSQPAREHNLTIFDPNEKILDTNLWINKNYIDIFTIDNIWLEIENMKIWNMLYVQYDNNIYEYYKVKQLAADSMDVDLNSFTFCRKYIDQLEHPTLIDEYDNVEIMHRSRENYTYGFMINILLSYFTKEKGFMVVPQGTNTDKLPDFTIKKHDFFFGAGEAKKFKRDFLSSYGQIIHNLKNNTGTLFTHEYDICIINHGTRITGGIFIPGLHSQLGFKNKSVFFDGYLGLTVDKNLKVSIVEQKDTYWPQHAIYELNKNSGQYNKIDTLFTYLSEIDDLVIYFKNYVWSTTFGLKSKVECNKNSLFKELNSDKRIDYTKVNKNFVASQDGLIGDPQKVRFIVKPNGTTYDLHS
jgi:hypothetical protein